MVAPADLDQVVELGGAAVGPVVDVVGVAEVEPAAGETAAAVAVVQRAVGRDGAVRRPTSGTEPSAPVGHHHLVSSGSPRPARAVIGMAVRGRKARAGEWIDRARRPPEAVRRFGQPPESPVQQEPKSSRQGRSHSSWRAAVSCFGPRRSSIQPSTRHGRLGPLSERRGFGGIAVDSSSPSAYAGGNHLEPKQIRCNPRGSTLSVSEVPRHETNNESSRRRLSSNKLPSGHIRPFPR